MAAEYSISATIRAIDRFTAPFRSMVGRASSAIRSLDRVATSVLKGIGGAFLGGGVLALGAKKLVDFVSSYTTGADEISKASRRIGLAAESYQGIEYAAGLAGVATGEFSASMRAFGRSLGELRARGGGAMAEFVKKADPALFKVLKRTKTTEEAFWALMGAMSKIEDPTQRAALAAASFGEAGGKMTVMVENGTDALRDQIKEAEALGLIMGPAQLKRAEDWNDAMARFTGFLGGGKRLVADSLIQALLPQLNEFNKWVMENPDRFRKIAGDIGKGLADAFRAVVDALRWIVEHKDAVLGFFYALAGVKIIGGVTSLAGAVGKLVGMFGGGAAATAGGSAVASAVAGGGGAAAAGGGGLTGAGLGGAVAGSFGVGALMAGGGYGLKLLEDKLYGNAAQSKRDRQSADMAAISSALNLPPALAAGSNKPAFGQHGYVVPGMLVPGMAGAQAAYQGSQFGGRLDDDLRAVEAAYAARTEITVKVEAAAGTTATVTGTKTTGKGRVRATGPSSVGQPRTYGLPLDEQ